MYRDSLIKLGLVASRGVLTYGLTKPIIIVLISYVTISLVQITRIHVVNQPAPPEALPVWSNK